MPHDLTRLAPWCVRLTWAWAAAILGLTAVEARELWILSAWQDGRLSDGEIDQFYGTEATFTDAAALLCVLVILTAYTANAIWLYRSSGNAGALAPDDARLSPGWSVGAFAIPIVNLFLPYRGIKQTWNTSHGLPLGAPAPRFFAIWWGAWIISDVLANAAFRFSLQSDDIEAYVLSLQLGLAATPFSLVAGWCFLRILREVTAAQTNHSGTAEIFA